MMLRNLLIVCLLSLPFWATAQLQENRARALLREGNAAYEKGNYADSQVAYDKALELKPESPEGHFNLGDALYQQQRFPEAIQSYQLAAQMGTDDAAKARAYHNIGNAHMAQQEYDKSVVAYSQALRHNPNDADSRYNLAYALQMLRKQEQQQQQQDQNGDQNQDQDDQKQDQQNDQQQDESEQQQDPSEGDQENQPETEDGQQDKDQPSSDPQQKDQLKPQGMSREQIDQMLENLQMEEKELLEEIPKRKAKPKASTNEKDW